MRLYGLHKNCFHLHWNARMLWVLKFSPRNTLKQNLCAVMCANACTSTARLIPVASHIWVLDPWIWMWVHKVVHWWLLCAQQFSKHIRSGKAKQFCCHVYSWLIWGMLLSIFDDHVLAWPLCPVMDTCCFAISCSWHPISTSLPMWLSRLGAH